MTRDETMKILATMQAAYPNYKPVDKSITLNTWTVLLQEYTYEQAITALKSYITSDTSGFAPAIGQLISMVQKIEKPLGLNEMEAWALVSRALRNGYYGAEEEFSKLPLLVQKAVGSPDNLRNWSQTDTESVENVIQSNFMRTYRTVVSRDAEIGRMPQEIRAKIDKVCVDRLQMADKKIALEGQTAEEHRCVPMPEGLSKILREELMRN